MYVYSAIWKNITFANTHVHVHVYKCMHVCAQSHLHDMFLHIQVFSNMTSNIRKALFKSLMAQSIENENTVIIDNGEEVQYNVHALCTCT